MAFKTSKLWASDGFHSPNHWETKTSQCFNMFIAKLAETSHLLPGGWMCYWGHWGLLLQDLKVLHSQAGRWRASVPGWEVLWIITSTLTDACVPSLLRNQHKAAADREAHLRSTGELSLDRTIPDMLGRIDVLESTSYLIHKLKQRRPPLERSNPQT